MTVCARCGTTEAVLADELRTAATLLEKFNDLYSFHRIHGNWSPHMLRHEADYLEANP